MKYKKSQRRVLEFYCRNGCIEPFSKPQQSHHHQKASGMRCYKCNAILLSRYVGEVKANPSKKMYSLKKGKTNKTINRKRYGG